MIKASELRIGNAIWDDAQNKIKWVSHRVISDLASHANPLPYSPIPLTPEWLERCGYKDEGSHDGGSCAWREPNFPFGITKGNGTIKYNLYYYDDNDCIYPADVQFVHQLQNLYFALTGEELKIAL